MGRPLLTLTATIVDSLHLDHPNETTNEPPLPSTTVFTAPAQVLTPPPPSPGGGRPPTPTTGPPPTTATTRPSTSSTAATTAPTTRPSIR